MKNRNKLVWFAIGGIVLAVALVLGLRLWFLSPGIHVFGGDIHVELSQKCYIIDGKTGEVVDETSVSINGSTSSEDSELFDGELKVLGYQNSATGTITSLQAIEADELGGWKITHMENCTHQENVNGIIQDVEHFCDYHYTYYIDAKDPELLVVLVESFDKDQPQYAVFGNTEEDALIRYHNFLEARSLT